MDLAVFPDSSRADDVDAKGSRRRWLVLAVLCLSLVVIVMDNTILNVAVPSLVRDLGATNSQLQWIVDAYTLVFAGLLLTAGTLGDKYGRKRALSLGLMVFGVGSAAVLLVSTPAQLVGIRAFMGIGGALIMPATLSILTNVFRDPTERGRAIAIWAGTSGIGVALGPVVGGFLLDHFSWHSVFVINLPIIALAVVAGWFIVPDSRDDHAPRIDVAGAVMSIVGLVTLVWALIEAPRYGWTDPLVLGGFAVAAIVLAGFVWWELRSDHPMLDVRFFQNRRFSAANGAITLTFFAMFGAFFLLTQYLQFVKGYSPFEAGTRLLPMAAGMMIAAPLSARLVERVGTKIVVSVGLLIAAAGLASLAGLAVDSSYLAIASRMILLAIGMGFVMAPATEAVMGSLPPQKAGVGSAVNDTTREVGGALGVAIIGSLVSTAYASNIAAAGAGLAPQTIDVAKQGLGGALAVSARLGPAGPAFADAARTVFVDAFGTGALVGAGVVAVAAVLTAIFLPSRATDSADELDVAMEEQNGVDDLVLVRD